MSVALLRSYHSRGKIILVDCLLAVVHRTQLVARLSLKFALLCGLFIFDKWLRRSQHDPFGVFELLFWIAYKARVSESFRPILTPLLSVSLERGIASTFRLCLANGESLMGAGIRRERILVQFLGERPCFLKEFQKVGISQLFFDLVHQYIERKTSL